MCTASRMVQSIAKATKPNLSLKEGYGTGNLCYIQFNIHRRRKRKNINKDLIVLERLKAQQNGDK